MKEERRKMGQNFVQSKVRNKWERCEEMKAI